MSEPRLVLLEQRRDIIGNNIGNLVSINDAEMNYLGLEPQDTNRPAYRLQLVNPVTNRVYASIFSSNEGLDEIQPLWVYNRDKNINEPLFTHNIGKYKGLKINRIIQFKSFDDYESHPAIQLADGTYIFGVRDFEENGPAYLWYINKV